MAISNGYCAYDTWDMLRVSLSSLALLSVNCTSIRIPQIGMASQAMNLMVHHALLLAAFYLALELVSTEHQYFYPRPLALFVCCNECV